MIAYTYSTPIDGIKKNHLDFITTLLKYYGFECTIDESAKLIIVKGTADCTISESFNSGFLISDILNVGGNLISGDVKEI